uniref:Uncharacterized protein n=1 Tax=Physcomitrium patens TaxID=3218 RepID=A0A2K1K4B1_PHYPA|nr:hypothetical protein PHYPA_013092 [Physcomitrium patens]
MRREFASHELVSPELCWMVTDSRCDEKLQHLDRNKIDDVIDCEPCGECAEIGARGNLVTRSDRT